MKIIDLFAGAGGLSEGFRRNGLDVIAHVEMDTNASLTLKTREAYYYCLENNKINLYKNYIQGKISRDEFYSNIPNSIFDKVLNYEISSKTFPTIVEKIDYLLGDEKVAGIIGGPPCQAYSIAGRSRDKDNMENDPRNYLYKYYLNFIKYYQPTFFVFENVLGLLSAKKGKIFENIKKEMQALGYDIYCNILNSSDFGVLQSRKRVIISGWKKECKISQPVYPKVDKKYSINNLFSDLPSILPGEVNNQYKKSSNKCLIDLKIRNKNWNILTYNMCRPLNNNDSNIYYKYISIWNEEKRQLKYDELPHNLITHKNTKSFLDRYKVIDGDGISQTIVAHIAKDGHHFIHPDINQCRSITVREAARIQSFPDDYYFESSRTSAFQQIGNAVPPLMAEIICKVIMDKLNFKNHP